MPLRTLTGGVRRVQRAGRTLIQSTIAAGSAWALAGLIPHHLRPYFAPIAAVICVSLAIGQHTRRATEIAAGVAVGVLVGDGLVRLVGVGGWQIALGVGLAMSVAVFLGGSGLVMNQAASSAVLITALPLAPGTAFYSRFIDALIGGVVGVIVSLAVPIRPVAVITRAAGPLLTTMIAEMRATENALRTASVADAQSALDRLRATEPALRQLEAAVAAGLEAARLAPARRRSRTPIAQIAGLAVHLDRAVRNQRVLVRRAVRLILDDATSATTLAAALYPLTEALECLRRGLTNAEERISARDYALESVCVVEAHRIATDDLSYAVVIGQVRSIAVDLLRATGLSEAEALEQVRSIGPRTT